MVHLTCDLQRDCLAFTLSSQSSEAMIYLSMTRLMLRRLTAACTFQTASEDRIPPDAYVEMQAKKAAGYYTEGPGPNAAELAQPLGRGLQE